MPEPERSSPSQDLHRVAGARRRSAIAGAVIVAVCATLVVVIVLGGGRATVDSALKPAGRPPTGAAEIGAGGPLLAERFEGLRFPSYAATFGWTAVGARTDDVDGRLMHTVFYERGGRTIAYTCVSGKPLRRPESARTELRNGVALTVLRRADRNVVTFNREAHPCVLSGVGVAHAKLLELASWRAAGRVPF